jgi:hypothetical protein
MDRTLVDLDAPSTWPHAVLEWAQAQAAALSGSTEFTCDLSNELIEREAEFRALFDGTKMLVYHCTRLLDWEADDIRRAGLVPLTRDLVERRIDQAERRGVLDAGEADRLRRSHTFALGEEDGRKDQVCFVAGREGLDDSGIHYLVNLWGGEGIYWAHADDPDPPTEGRPAIVVAAIDVSDRGRELRFDPALPKLFVGILLGTRDNYADVFLQTAVPASDIIDIWQPGHPEYNRLSNLPSS